MKHIALILFLIIGGCSNDETQTDKGCLTGIPKSGPPERVLIRCSTNKEYLAGNNTSAGGTASWDLYTAHQWAKCNDCK